MPITPLDPNQYIAAGPPTGASGVFSPFALSDTAEQSRPTFVEDTFGTQKKHWGVIGSLPCKLWPKPTMKEIEQGLELKPITVWKCSFQLGADVKPEDRFVIKGRTYSVIETDEGLTDAVLLTTTLVRQAR